MRHALALGLICSGLFACAGARAAEGGAAPLPPERPAEQGPPAPPVPEPAVTAPGVPIPPERPPEAGSPASPAAEGEAPEDLAPLPPERPVELGGRPAEPAKPPATTDAAEEACRTHLKELGATFEDVPAISEGVCGAPRPVRLANAGAGIAITPPATLTCAMAEGIARWAKEVVGPAAEAAWHKPASAIRIGTTYQCRGQNHDPNAKLSEHAYANGADVAAFDVGPGTSVTVATQKEGSPEETFQKTVREGACPIFTTVLGPGTNAEHANHLHVDMRGRSNGYRICQ
jgi:hypothetical protein